MVTNTNTHQRLVIADLRERTTLSVEEAGRILGLGRSGAYEAVRRGDIPVLRIGRRVVVPAPTLMRMLGVESDQRDDAAR